MLESETIVQPYAITLCKNRLTLPEMRVMIRVIEALQKDMKYGKTRSMIQNTLFGDKIIKIPTKSLLPDGNQNYSAVKAALKTLANKSIHITGKDEKGRYDLDTHLIIGSKYYLNNEMVELQIHRDLLPSYLALAKNYTRYLVAVAFNSSSPNVMKLYQYISHWKDKPQIKVMVEDLRDWLQLDNKYQRSNDIYKRILYPASRELEEKADIYYKIKEPIKLGRRVVGWTLRLFKKSLTDKELQKAQVYGDNIRFYLKEQFRLRNQDMIEFEEFIKKPELHQHIWNAMHRVAKQMVNHSNPIKSTRGYMIKTLKNEMATLL